jgi:hypothetical protein
MLPLVLTLLASTVGTPAAAEAPRQEPAIRVWLNKSGYVEPTDKVRAYVRAGVDGYVMILHAEPSGRVRVLFPLDPEDDAFVRAGRDYEIRSRADKEAFVVYDGTGTGAVLAAVSRDPFRFEGLVLNRHWDYRVAEFGVGDDAEADLLALVQRVTGGGWFEYDVVRYEVASPYTVARGDDAYHLSFYGPRYHGHYWHGGVGFSIRFGSRWYDPWYDPWYDAWYDPWYDPWYYGGYYPHYWSSWYPWYWYDGWYRPYRSTYVYSYPYGYAPGGTHVRHVYPGSPYGGAWGSYAFKSTEDRYGLHPQSVTARRRTAGAATTFASSPVPRTVSGTRRTAAASSPASSPSTPGSLEPRRRPTAAAPATVLPTINGRSRTPAPQSGDVRNSRGAEGRRTIGDSRTPVSEGDVQRRGLEITPPGRTVTPADEGRRTLGPATSPSGMRQVEPRGVGDAPSRPAQGTVGSGRTTKPSSGSLERRSPSRTVSPPRSTTPSRTVSPPRSTTRSAPARSTPPRAAPSRPPTRSSPPARSSSPPPARRKN